MSVLDFKPNQDLVIDAPETTKVIPYQVAIHSEMGKKPSNRFFAALRQRRATKRNRIAIQDHRVHEDYRARESQQAIAQESVLRAWGQVRL